MRELNSRYTEFGNSIISRYCGFDTYYDPITLLFPKMHEEIDESTEQPQYTNINQLWYLKEENHIYENNLTFLTNLLEKNIHNHIAFSIQQQVKRIILDRLPQLKDSIVKQMTNETVGLFRYEKNENRREELVTRLLEGKYEIEKGTAQKLYDHLKEKTYPQIKDQHFVNVNYNNQPVKDNQFSDKIFQSNTYNENIQLKSKLIKQKLLEIFIQWLNHDQSKYQIMNELNHDTFLQQTLQSKSDRTEIYKDATENKSYYITENTGYIEKINEIVNPSKQNLQEIYQKWVNISQREAYDTNIFENINFVQNINKILRQPMNHMMLNQKQFNNVDNYKNSHFNNEIHSYDIQLPVVHPGQAKKDYENVTENKFYIQNIHHIQQNKNENAMSRYSHWLNQNLNVHQNEQHLYETKSFHELINSPENDINQTVENNLYIENINKIIKNKMENPMEFYSHWMNQNEYSLFQNQTYNQNKRSLYQSEYTSYPINTSELYFNQTNIAEGDVTKNNSHLENIIQIQQKKIHNIVKNYNPVMKQNQFVNQSINHLYHNENTYHPMSRLNSQSNDTEKVKLNTTVNQKYTENIYQVQQNKIDQSAKYHNHMMNKNLNQSDKRQYLSENQYSLQHRSEEYHNHTNLTYENKTQNENNTKNIYQIQQKKMENLVEFYNHWMNQKHISKQYENSWNQYESLSYPFQVSQVNPIISTRDRLIDLPIEHDRLNINQIPQYKKINPMEFYEHVLRRVENEHKYKQMVSKDVQLNQVNGYSDINLVHESNERVREQEKERKHVHETQKQIQKDIKFLKETRNEVEQLHETYQQWERRQKYTEEQTIKLDSEQGKNYIQQQAKKIFEQQMDSNVNQLTTKVYRKLSQKLRSEKDRRGYM